MSDSRKQLEQHLLKDPFDSQIRERYAQLLLDDGEWEAGLEQWQILLKQAPRTSDWMLSAAICHAKLGRAYQATELLEAARACGDFDEDDPRLAELPDVESEKKLRVMSGGRAEVPRGEVVSISSSEKIRFSDVVGMEGLKKTLRLRIVEPFIKPGLFQRFKKSSGGGVLLYGPPGCGKTMIARAIATECEASFTAVGISDVLSMWIGQSERALASVFDSARQQTPSVLFFDELDALAFSRSKANSDSTRTMVNEFLAQLDGVDGTNERVLVLAATNMPWDVDDAMKRPGRFDRQVFVPPPDNAARAEMYRMKLIGVPTDELDWEALGARSAHFSGADVDGAIDRAKETVLSSILENGEERNLAQQDLLQAIEESEPSTMEWLKTARNLVKYGGGGRLYKDVEKYLRSVKLY